MSEKRRRVELSIKKKLEIIAACDGPPKQSFAEVAKKFSIDRSTVSKIYKNKGIVIEAAGSTNINRKRLRPSKVEDVDEALHRWFVSAVAADLPISGEILRTKAEKFANEFGLESFSASNGWLDRWKKRYGVAYKKSHGEKIDTDVSAADQWLSTTLWDSLQDYKSGSPKETDASTKIKKEEDDVEITEIVVTKTMALMSLQVLRTFLSKEGVQDWSHFNQLEEQVHQVILKNAKKKKHVS